MIKKIIGTVLVVVLCLTSLCACKKYKIDVGGEVQPDKFLSPLAIRAMMKETVFLRDDNVNITVGWGFRSSDIRSFVAEAIPIEFTIKCDGFSVFDGEDVFQNEYNKSITEYSDNEFFCDKKRKHYYPNHYEAYTFRLRTHQEDAYGSISFIMLVEPDENTRLGDSITIFYAMNKEKIAFSAESEKDAKKRLK